MHLIMLIFRYFSRLLVMMVKKSNLGRFNFEQINSLPGDMGNRIILDKILGSCGPMSAKGACSVAGAMKVGFVQFV